MQGCSPISWKTTRKRPNAGDRNTAKPQAATKNTPQSNNDPDSQTVN